HLLSRYSFRFPLSPYTTLFRSVRRGRLHDGAVQADRDRNGRRFESGAVRVRLHHPQRSGRRDRGSGLAPPLQDKIKRTLAPVAAVRFSYGGNVAGVRAGSEPVEHFGPDRPAPLPPVGGFGGPRLARDQQHQPRAHGLGLPEAPIEAAVCWVERVTVQVERDVGGDGGARELALPGGVEAQPVLPALVSRRGTAGAQRR